MLLLQGHDQNHTCMVKFVTNLIVTFSLDYSATLWSYMAVYYSIEMRPEFFVFCR